MGFEREHAGYSGNGYLRINAETNLIVPFAVDIPSPGWYAVDFRYANGNGPLNTGDACAVRTLVINRKNVGTVVMPQRGTQNWTDWGYSNAVEVDLPAGNQILELQLRGVNANMNGAINEALIDCIRLRKLR